MGKFVDAASTALADLGRKLAAKLTPVTGNYRQPVRIIPGMPNAPEPCALFGHWSEAGHPRDAYAQLKVDGIRALYVDTSIVSRQALPLDCALHCLPGLHAIEQAYGEPMVFDGEYVEPAGFNATLAAHKRGWGVGRVWLFDAVPYSQWRDNRFTERLDVRVPRLNEIVQRLKLPFVDSLPLHPMPTVADAMAEAETVWARGGEGIVVKAGSSRYERGRTRAWSKIKRRESADGVIVDLDVRGGVLKALLVKVTSECTGLPAGRVVKVAAGIPDDLRADIERNWRSGKSDGQAVEFGFGDTTEAGAPRGAYFIRLREDKGAKA